MAFPQTVLPVRVRIAPGGQPAADPSTWVWVDITQWTRVAAGITIEAGRADESARVDPGKCTLTLDNRDGRFSTRNTAGAYYGSLAKGCPLRVGTIAVQDTFTRTVSPGLGDTDNGLTWSAGTPSVWSTNGSVGQVSFSADNLAYANTLPVALKLLDLDAYFTASVPAVQTGASTYAAWRVHYLNSSNYYWFSIEFDTGGAISASIRLTLAGVNSVLATVSPVPSLTYTANEQMRARVQADGPALRMKVWAAAGSEPDDWTLTTTADDLPNAGRTGLFVLCLSGNTNTKPFSVSVDNIEVESIEFTGTVPEWPPRWDQSQNDATTPIVATGILRRLQQGNSPLRSPIPRMVLRQSSAIELWPVEDESSATVAASAMSGGIPASIRSLDFAQSTPALAGVTQTAAVTTSTVVTYKIRPHTSTGTWGVVWYAQLLAKPAATTVIMSVYATGTVRRWDIMLDSTTFNLLGYDAGGTQIFSAGAAYSALAAPPMWTAFDLLVDQDGGNIDGTLILYGVDPENLTTGVFVTSTVAGTIGSPTGGKIEGSLGYNGGRLGPISAFNAEPSFVTSTFFWASNGYVGETAAARITRLCDEESVQVVVESGTSEELGPQRVDTFVGLLNSAADADLGVLYERGAGLAYRPRGARYNRTVELALDFAAGDVARPPEPTDDDQQLRNRWVVSRDSGSSATAEDAALIASAGLIDESVTVNVAGDHVLSDHAGWRLAMSTVDTYRWPSIALDMARNTDQIDLWRAAQPWPRVTIANEPSEVAGVDVDVTVVGYRSTIGPKSWDLELVCAPSQPWTEVAVYDTGRATSGTTTLGVARDTTQTSWTFSTTDPMDVWSTTSEPYDVAVGVSPRVEVVTVTSMGAASGSGPWTQTATVTRSVNGAVLSHDAGVPITLHPPARAVI